MFPKNIKFVSTPSLLQQAVESLPEPKGKVRRSVSNDNALRSKLLEPQCRNFFKHFFRLNNKVPFGKVVFFGTVQFEQAGGDFFVKQ